VWRAAPSAAGWPSCAAENRDTSRVRRRGGGCKPLIETDTSLLNDLRSLVEPDTRGDPQSSLLWTCKSLTKLSQGLREMGHKIGRTLVGELLHKLEYSLQGNRKTLEGSKHPDRDAQFRYINDCVNEALAAGAPAISLFMAFLSFRRIETPEPIGSRCATPPLLFQHRPGHPRLGSLLGLIMARVIHKDRPDPAWNRTVLIFKK
jgi:hypothetical protein